MHTAKTRYGWVGDGRLARHLHRYFDRLHLPYRHWSRRSSVSLSETLGDCSVIGLAISDHAIEPLAQELRARWGDTKTIVHFSGVLRSPNALGFHPLMTFGETLYDLETYQAIPFIGERSDDPKTPSFKEVFPELENPFYSIDPEQKALYHALCVMGGNFTSFLWTRVFESFEKNLGLPPQAALPYLRQITENLSRNPHTPRRTWTGPIVRGDQATIAKNLQALGGDPYQQVYRAFTEAIQNERP